MGSHVRFFAPFLCLTALIGHRCDLILGPFDFGLLHHIPCNPRHEQSIQYHSRHGSLHCRRLDMWNCWHQLHSSLDICSSFFEGSLSFPDSSHFNHRMSKISSSSTKPSSSPGTAYVLHHFKPPRCLGDCQGTCSRLHLLAGRFKERRCSRILFSSRFRCHKLLSQRRKIVGRWSLRLLLYRSTGRNVWLGHCPRGTRFKFPLNLLNLQIRATQTLSVIFIFEF
mmetsp:Transcript_10955/g.21876  ORF Transcript_10955/g.21876 Transcript_10955/m.21876 type:complete len:224 (-) Transcript_10955:784-1455(-)